MWFDLMAIPADAPNPEQAHAFINFILRPEVAASISNEVSYAAGQRGAEKQAGRLSAPESAGPATPCSHCPWQRNGYVPGAGHGSRQGVERQRKARSCVQTEGSGFCRRRSNHAGSRRYWSGSRPILIIAWRCFSIGPLRSSAAWGWPSSRCISTWPR